MANIASAKKKARQAIKRNLNNSGNRSMLRTFIRRVIAAIQTGNREQALTAYREATPVIDRMANKGLIHKNKAARHKERLNAQIQALQ
ncbi:MAG: 30S ribosomal protein S20 [Gammaproteobacteria bacterium]|nr:MAG: 30S ribosomal protein S20 [Gammaproteobacteria bacterium]